VGELVITTLTREALPVVRFRTRDLTSLVTGRCACGRTLARMGRVKGRTDDLLSVKGARAFPSEIEAVLFEVEGTAPPYQIALERRGGQDEATVLVEADESLAGRGEARADLQAAIQRRLAAELGVAVEVRVVDPRSIVRSAGKARRVLDARKG
jgi:phenylacetate-CoA ligase